MARPSKIEVSAINIRIPAEMNRDYAALVKKLVQIRRGIRVHGSTYVAFTNFGFEKNMGIISKYTEIDVDGDWFDIEFFDIASDEDIEQISIPEKLKPNFSQFYFELNSELHVVAFETYSESKSLSSRSVQKYFDEILKIPEIREEFGYVEADIIKSYGEVDRILSLPQLKELRFVIRRPNPDDISRDDAADIEERLREQKAEEYEESIKTKAEDGIVPNERSKKLAAIAAENGQVSAKSIVKGVTVEHNTTEKPFKEVETFNKEEKDAYKVFKKLAKSVFGNIEKQRSAVRN